MRKSNFGSSSAQRQSVLKPRNADSTPTSKLSSGLRKVRGSTEGSTRLSQVTGRFTPTRSNIPRYTPIRNNGPSSNTLVPPPSTSRMSTDSVRNSSMGGKNRKETRPIGDPAFKSECIDKILSFLDCNGFEFQVNRRTLLNPSTKDFTNMFSFIYRHFEPSLSLPHKFEEEIPRLMKLLKYPNQLAKSTFISVGSRHTWPVVLAMLAWIIDSLSIYLSTDAFLSVFPTNFDLDSSLKQKRLTKFFDIYACSENSDEILDQCEDYNHTMEQLYEVRTQDIIGVQEYNEKLEEEISRASSGPERLEQLNLQYEQLMNDKEKMVCYNRELQVHITAKDTERTQLESKLAEFKCEVLQISEQRICLETIKAEQALSSGELARFKNHAKDVATLISQLQVQGKVLDNEIWSSEMALGKAQKDLSEKMSNHNAVVQKLDLAESFKLEPGNVENSIEYWKKNLVGDLYECKKNAKHTAFEIKNQLIRKEEELAMVQENVKERNEAASKMESKLRRLEEDITMTKKEILTEEKEMQQEIERLHQQIVEARKGHKTSLYQKQYAVDQSKEELEATKAYGKERMRSGAEFLAKVCNTAQEDLDFKTNTVLHFKQDVKKCCKELLDSVKDSDS